MEFRGKCKKSVGMDVDLLKKLITDRSSLRRSILVNNRIVLQEQVLPRRPDFLSPLSIFPEEIWLKIFKNVADDNLWNLSNASPVFRNYLEPCFYLFRKVLPILLHQKFVNVNDILNCRLVSKDFRFWIDSFFESMDSWTKITTKCPECLVKLMPPVKTCINIHVKKEILEHSRNPFVGRAVCVSLGFREEIDDDVHEVSRMMMRNAIEENAQYHHYDDLQDRDENLGANDCAGCGVNIWYLCLKSKDASSRLTVNSVLGILGKCPNLKRFEISEEIRILTVNDAKLRKAMKVLNVPFLTTLVMIGVETRAKLCLQNALVRKFSDQLQELQLTEWNTDYCQLDWSNLRNLQLGKVDSIQALKSLYRMKAVKLRTLVLLLYGTVGEGTSLHLLLQTINHFSQLEDLVLQFNSDWKILEKEIEPLPEEPLDLCSFSLKRLHVRTGFSDKITYSFLLYFPRLENLHISYGCKGLDPKSTRNSDNRTWVGHYPELLVDKELYLRSGMKIKSKESELLEIRDYIYINRKYISKSVIWNVLPFLRSIKITGHWRSRGSYLCKTTEYPRSA